MIKHICTACTVKIYRFATDPRACPVCAAPMVITPRPSREPMRAVPPVAAAEQPAALG